MCILFCYYQVCKSFCYWLTDFQCLTIFLEILHWYFKGRLEELNTSLGGEYQEISESQDKDDMDLDDKCKLPNRTGDMETVGCYPQGRLLENNNLVKNIGKVVHDLRSVGFTSMAEDAYASAIFMLLKVNIFLVIICDYLHVFGSFCICELL